MCVIITIMYSNELFSNVRYRLLYMLVPELIVASHGMYTRGVCGLKQNMSSSHIGYASATLHIK